MKKTRFFALLLTLVLLFGTLPGAAQAASSPLLPKVRDYPGFADVKGSRDEQAVKTVYETTMMEAGGKNAFKPNGILSNAQVIAICARLHDFLTGGDGELPRPAKGAAWYQPFYDHLAKALTTSPDALLSTYPPKRTCYRCDFADLLERTLSTAQYTLPVLNDITVLQDTSDARVLTLYNAGILKGTGPYGAFEGSKPLTRGEAAAMLARVIDPAQRLTFTLVPYDLYQVLGVKPEDVLFRINGEPVTAAQGICLLAESITSTSPSDYSFATAEAYVVTTFQKVFATQLLAKQKGISLSETEHADMAAQAKLGTGYRGAPMESLLWSYNNSLLRRKVKDAYIQEFGINNSHGISDQFSADLSQQLPGITLERTPVTESKQLGAFRVKLIDSPFYAFHGRDPWED